MLIFKKGSGDNCLSPSFSCIKKCVSTKFTSHNKADAFVKYMYSHYYSKEFLLCRIKESLYYL